MNPEDHFMPTLTIQRPKELHDVEVSYKLVNPDTGAVEEYRWEIEAREWTQITHEMEWGSNTMTIGPFVGSHCYVKKLGVPTEEHIERGRD